MKTRINPFLISAFIFLQSALVFSQNHDIGVTPQKYNFSVSVMGGESIFTNEFLTTGDSYSKAQPNLNASFTYFLSDSKAFNVDAGYTFMKPYSGFYSTENYSAISNKMYSFKGNFLLGRFKPDERFIYYFSLGFGIYISKDFVSADYNYSFNPTDSSRVNYGYSVKFQTEVSGLASIGGSVGYRFIKGFGVRAEAEYDMVTGKHQNYFPVRAGLFYIF